MGTLARRCGSVIEIRLTVLTQRSWKAIGAGLPTVTYVWLHLHVHVLRVSVVGARLFRVAGRAINTIATSVLSRLETRIMPLAGSYGWSQRLLSPQLKYNLKKTPTEAMKSETTTTAFSAKMAALVPIRVCSSLMSKWLGHDGRNHGLSPLEAAEVKTWYDRPAVPMMPMLRHMERSARLRVGVRREGAIS